MRLDGHSRGIKIFDIEGIWESSTFRYHFLDIRENKNGYLISILNEEYYENYVIRDIEFDSGAFIMKLTSLDEKKENIQLKGVLLGDDIVNLKHLEDEENDDLLFFFRISKVTLLREKAKELIIGYEKSKT